MIYEGQGVVASDTWASGSHGILNEFMNSSIAVTICLVTCAVAEPASGRVSVFFCTIIFVSVLENLSSTS